MNFNKHLNLEGQHAFLGASKYHWIHYDDDKLISAYKKHLATERGTRLHALAKECIEMGVKLKDLKKTLNLYVNDAIGFKMTPEQVLYYSPYAFGTADAISFRDGYLRIHDLKTGSTPVSMNQLLVYTALFCLEYDKKPKDISVELRIYQSNEVVVFNPMPEDILPVMDKIVRFDKILSAIDEEE